MAIQIQRNIDRVLLALLQPLDTKVRNAVARRHDAMLRELAFLVTKEDERLLFIRTRRWSDSKLSVLFSLNCIYQEVLGPLAVSARTRLEANPDAVEPTGAGLGSTNPILHGSQRFDSAHTFRVKNALDTFFEMVSDLGFRRDWMTKNTCGDLVYWIERYERDREVDGGDADQ